jgi:hypothetical protein
VDWLLVYTSTYLARQLASRICLPAGEPGAGSREPGSQVCNLQTRKGTSRQRVEGIGNGFLWLTDDEAHGIARKPEAGLRSAIATCGRPSSHSSHSSYSNYSNYSN